MLSCLNWRSSIALTVSHLRSRSPCCTAPMQFSLKKFPIMTQDKKMLNICLGGTYWVIRSSVTLSENLTCKSTIKIFLYLEIFSFCLEGQDESRSVIAYRAGSRPQRLSRPQSLFFPMSQKGIITTLVHVAVPYIFCWLRTIRAWVGRAGSMLRHSIYGKAKNWK